MSVAERDFSDFRLGDNVYELAGGLVPEVAERLEVDISGEPNSHDLDTLVGKLGKNKVLRESEEVTAIDRDTMADLLERSGVQKALSRSLWTPAITVQSGEIDAVVMTGAVANWQDRIAKWVSPRFDKPVHYATTDRVMDSATEKINPNVKDVFDYLGRYPTETEYAAMVIVPKLAKLNLGVTPYEYPGASGDQVAARLFEDNPDLAGQNIAFARVANAGIQLVVQMRKGARTVNPDFDAIPEEPQAFVFTDTFPIARTAEQEADPQHYQKPQTGLRQAILTAKMLYEAARNE